MTDEAREVKLGRWNLPGDVARDSCAHHEIDAERFRYSMAILLLTLSIGSAAVARSAAALIADSTPSADE